MLSYIRPTAGLQSKNFGGNAAIVPKSSYLTLLSLMPRLSITSLGQFGRFKWKHIVDEMYFSRISTSDNYFTICIPRNERLTGWVHSIRSNLTQRGLIIFVSFQTIKLPEDCQLDCWNDDRQKRCHKFTSYPCRTDEDEEGAAVAANVGQQLLRVDFGKVLKVSCMLIRFNTTTQKETAGQVWQRSNWNCPMTALQTRAPTCTIANSAAKAHLRLQMLIIMQLKESLLTSCILDTQAFDSKVRKSVAKLNLCMRSCNPSFTNDRTDEYVTKRYIRSRSSTQLMRLATVQLRLQILNDDCCTSHLVSRKPHWRFLLRCRRHFHVPPLSDSPSTPNVRWVRRTVRRIVPFSSWCMVAACARHGSNRECM